MVSFQWVLMAPVTHSIEGLFPKNLPKAENANEEMQVATASFEIEIPRLSPSLEMGIEGDLEGERRILA